MNEIELSSINRVDTAASSDSELTIIEIGSRKNSTNLPKRSTAASTSEQSAHQLEIPAEDRWTEEPLAPSLGIERDSKTTPFQTAVKVNLTFLWFCSKFTGMPLKVEVGEQKVTVDRRLWKRVFWLFNLNIVTLHTLNALAGVFLTFTVEQFHNPRFDFLFLMLSVTYLTCNIFIFELLEHHVESYAIIWNSIIKYQTVPLKVPMIQTWYPILFPVLAPFASTVMCAFIVVNPEFIIQFRFAVDWTLAQGYLDDGLIYKILVVIATAADIWANYQMIFFVAAFQHVIFLEMWSAVTRELSNRCTSATIGAHQAWRTLTELLLFLRIFNIANSNLLFFFKCTSLTTGIVSIALLLLMDFEGDLIMLFVISFMTAASLTIYPILYSRAYIVESNLKEVKLELLRAMSFHRQDPAFRRKILSVSAKGIWVGSFRTYERESLLLYYSFMFEQVVSIVLSSK